MWRSSLWSVSCFITRCFTITSRFLSPRPAKVTIYATRCRHFLSFFLLFLACKESWDMWGHEGSYPHNREKKEHLEEPSDWDRLHDVFAPLKDADAELRHSRGLRVRVYVTSVWLQLNRQCESDSWGCEVEFGVFLFTSMQRVVLLQQHLVDVRGTAAEQL